MSRSLPSRFARLALPLGMLAALLASGAASAQGSPTIAVLSTRADLISGGEALVQVDLPAGTDPSGARLAIDGSDVTSDFAVRPNGRFEGLVAGLSVGSHLLTVRLPDGTGSQLTLTNHPIGGPVFSGPQIQPWTCPAGSVDAQCDRPTSYAFFYRSNDPSLCNGGPALPISNPTSSGGCFLPYDPHNPPAKVPTTTTYNGKTVPYIIRVETGYQDRDQYKAAVLFDPANNWSPWAPQPQWDGTLEIPGGSSCGEAHGSGSAPGVTDDTALSRGVLVAAPALDNNGHNCNIVVQAEAVEMMKEHLIDAYGPVRYTIGSGCSGGSIYQQQVANAYPGLLNGLLPNCSFPDSWSTGMDPTDCALLLNYFGTQAAESDGWTAAQEAGVVDDSSISVCETWVNVYSYSKEGDPKNNGSPNNCGVGTNANDPNSVYNPATNPGGVRCDLAGYMPNVLGLRPPGVWSPIETQIGRGFVNNPYDNVGVQYGLKALRAGTITAQQFVDMNAQVGGFDINGGFALQRSVADPQGLVNVYRSGAVDEANNLRDVAIIDLRGHDDAEIHSDFRSYAMRARLDNAQGNNSNQAIWTGPAALVGYAGMTSDGFLAMHDWMQAAYTDASGKSLADRIVADKPASAKDTCFAASGGALPIDNATCTATVYPYYGAPRTGAGEPIADDFLKCTLKPLSKSDYPSGAFSDAQWTQLQTTFPAGVCDWSKPAVDQQPTIPWQTYQDANGNVIYGGTPMSPAPVSQPLGPSPAVPEMAVPALAVLTGSAAAGAVWLGRRRRAVR